MAWSLFRCGRATVCFCGCTVAALQGGGSARSAGVRHPSIASPWTPSPRTLAQVGVVQALVGDDLGERPVRGLGLASAIRVVAKVPAVPRADSAEGRGRLSGGAGLAPDSTRGDFVNAVTAYVGKVIVEILATTTTTPARGGGAVGGPGLPGKFKFSLTPAVTGPGHRPGPAGRGSDDVARATAAITGAVVARMRPAADEAPRRRMPCMGPEDPRAGPKQAHHSARPGDEGGAPFVFGACELTVVCVVGEVGANPWGLTRGG